MVFQVVRDGLELIVDLGHILLQLADGAGGADAGNDVLALRIDQVLAKEGLFAGGGVTREGNARAGEVVQVAEHHRHAR